MNCKPGDVAIVIKGRWPNVGKIVIVRHDHGTVDYSWMGYGMLPCWDVQSLGGKFDTEAGPTNKGFTPDLSLRRIRGITPVQGEEMRIKKALADFDSIAKDLIKIMRRYEEADKAERELLEVVEQL